MKRFLIGCLVLTACSRYTYYSITSEHSNLSHYRTFAWLPPLDSTRTANYDIADQNIRDEATSQLERRGLVLNANKPDLLVRYGIVINNQVKTINEPQYSYYGGGIYPRVVRYHGGRYMYYTTRAPFPVYVGDEIEKVPYKEGTLDIDFINRVTGRVVWRGYATGEIDNAQKAIKDIPQIVSGILNKLPLKPLRK